MTDDGKQVANDCRMRDITLVGRKRPKILLAMYAKNRWRPATVPNVTSSVAYIGDTATSDVIRYDHGPSRIEPSRPIVFFSVGRTSATEVEPVMPKTTNATAASVGDSFHDGRCCVVHAQNFSLALDDGGEDAVHSRRQREARRAANIVFPRRA